MPYSSQKKTTVKEVASRLSTAWQGNSMPLPTEPLARAKGLNRKELKELKEGGFFLKQEIAEGTE